MRVSFATLLPVVVSLTTWVASAHYHDGGAPLAARDWLDELTTRDLEYAGEILERRETLAEFSTRDLIDELKDRLERRGNVISKPKFNCPYCGKSYGTFEEAKDCATKPAILGGCKVAGAIKQTSQSSVKSKKK